MAVFKAGEEKNYGGNGGTGFFSIKKNKETKQVRFMYNSIDDVEGMAVHKIKLGNKDRYVNCPREYNDPLDSCPFCKKGIPTQARVFIPIYNLDENQVQVWDRGAKVWIGRIASFDSKYAVKKDKPLVSCIFDIERQGEEGDTKTDYMTYFIEDDDVTLEDLPQPTKVLGGLVLDKSAEEMQYYLDNGNFPATDDNRTDEAPVRRRSSASDGRAVGRRTPANRGGEEF